MYKKKTHIHFMGIGGIGMSGLAEILKLQGYNISGCDKDTNSSIIEHLKSIGCSIYQNHNTEHITNADVLVCTTAINKSNEEVNTALQKNIPVVHRSLILAELMRTKYSIAVSGAHGKTTTTSMISHILLESNIDPTIIVGGILKTISKNAHFGKSDFLVAEADESDRSFLNLYPTLAVITNIDKEHLETYKDLEDIKQTFIKFLNKLPFFGKAFLCIDNENVKSLLPIKNINAITYGFTQDANIMGEIIETTANGSTFNIYFNKNFIGQMNLNIAGRHNVLNALASIGIALELDIPLKKIQDALKTFKGVVRRFEFKGTYNKAEIFDDYGHHPTEINSTLLVAQKKAKNDLHVIFQPHRYTRTQKLWSDFVQIFIDNKNIKTLYVTDIYPASETPIDGITSKKLAQDIQNMCPNLKVIYYPTYNEITQDVKNILQPNDLLLTIGAGKVNEIAEELAALKS